MLSILLVAPYRPPLPQPALRGVALAFVLAAGFGLPAPAQATIRFVAQDATGAGNGGSWADAFLHPQDAVSASARGDEVWVKQARYVRKRGAPQVLTLKNGVSVYGGFAGDETSLAHRDPALHETILDGEHVVAHVVVTPGGGRLDGFTVTGGGIPPGHAALGGGFNGNTATLARLVFRDNRALSGGAISGANLVVNDSSFEDNHATSAGGAIHSRESLTVQRSSFAGNTVNGPSGGGIGGAICFGEGPLAIEDSSFVSNVADERGGAIDAAGDATSATVVLRRSSFADNQAIVGGAVSTGFSVPTVLVEDTSFARNVASSSLAQGGALSVSLSEVTLRRATFSANVSQMYGGGVALRLGSAVIEDSRFEDNLAVHGGGLLLDRTPHLVRDTVFQRNQAINGGGGGAALYPIETASDETNGTFERCRFEENVASVAGGALALAGGDTLVESSRFVGNQALLGGGVVAYSVAPSSDARLEMRNSVVAFNHASADGGGLWMVRSTGQIENDTFYGNAATGSGGGLWLDDGADVSVSNTILWNDTAPVGPEIRLGPIMLPENFYLAFSDVQGGWPGTGNVNADPGLRDPTLRDFHLTWPGSQALVDTGTPGFSPVYDFDGELRPIDGNLDGNARVDIGADELADPCEGHGDADFDGRCDPMDNCPYAANPGQQDSGGIGISDVPDGIGDVCQCGDVSGDGRVTVVDSVMIRRALLVPPTSSLVRPDLCDVGASTGCSVADSVILRRALLVPPTASVQQVCAPALP